jgi:2-polyprenyl-3-methyl-5-hydroxy-6-metoxy-1,4-benzoquinol methylase
MESPIRRGRSEEANVTDGRNEADEGFSEVRRAWEENADFWDARFGEGNAFQRVLIGPATERLLGLKPGETVLDVACGNGAFARKMAELGATVVACDFCERFLELAQEKSAARPSAVTYLHIDATKPAELRTLGSRRFDAAVSTMALMDMEAIEPLFSCLPELLKPSGRFVFSVLHPSFANDACRLVLEEEKENDRFTMARAVKVRRYRRPFTSRGEGMIGQPAPQYYFHRPLSLLLGAGFRAGFVLDALEEPGFDEGSVGARPLSWEHFPEIPPVLVARMRLR